MVQGFLTSSDREWLRGEKDYKHSESETNKKQDIRERVKQSLSDFEQLLEELPEGEMEKIFEELDEESDSHCVDEVAPVIEFLYTGLNTLSNDPEEHANYPNSDIIRRKLAFRNALTTGIARGKGNFEQPDIHGQPPDLITISSNTYLYETPKLDAIRSHVDTDRWRETNQGFMTDEIQDHDSVSVFIQTQIEQRIGEEITSRQQMAESNTKGNLESSQ